MVSLSAPKICADCRGGNHQHDRWTKDGTDAGCPFLLVPHDIHSGQCQCPVVLPVAGRPRGQHCATCRCGGDR